MKYILFFVLLFALCFSTFGQNKAAKIKTTAENDAGFVALDGKIYGEKELSGKIVVMNFWYSKCLPCVEEIPELNKIVNEYKDNKDIVFLGFATDEKVQLQKFLKKHPFEYAIIPDAIQPILKFSVPDEKGRIEIKFPTHIIVSREGKIILRETGIKGIGKLKNELKSLAKIEEK